MRKFVYFLFDSFEPEEVKQPGDDPRLVLNSSVDEILTEIVECPEGQCAYERLCSRFSADRVKGLLRIGLLRREEDRIFLDSPVIVKEDAAHLQNCFSEHTARIAGTLTAHRKAFYAQARAVDNGFSPEVNLYHLFCGGVLDGSFFDYISGRDVVTTSRVHPSGLDYLIIVYQIAPELDRLSRELLCSYNRFSDGRRCLQSFGDADGDRVDFFRFATQKRQGRVPPSLKRIEALWDAVGDVRERVLDAAESLVKTGSCEENCLRLLTEFGYVQKGKIAVPVYTQKDLPAMEGLEVLAETYLAEDMEGALTDPGAIGPLFCAKHGVAAGEIANELYHILFGQLNELLVQEGFVAAPDGYEGQGRYLKSIELM